MSHPPARREQLNMRLSEDERRIVERRAEIAGVSVSEFIREMIVFKKDDDAQMAQLKKVIATWMNISEPEANMRGALLAQLGDTAMNLASYRGYLSLKELDMIATIALKVRGLPGAYVKVSEESKSLNAHVHTTAPTWEQRIEEAQGGSDGAGDRRALSGDNDAGIIDIQAVVAGDAGKVGGEEVATAVVSRNGHRGGSRRTRAAELVPDSARDGAAGA